MRRAEEMKTWSLSSLDLGFAGCKVVRGDVALHVLVRRTDDSDIQLHAENEPTHLLADSAESLGHLPFRVRVFSLRC